MPGPILSGADSRGLWAAKNTRREAGGLGVSPSSPFRAGGWDEGRHAGPQEEHGATRDTTGGGGGPVFIHQGTRHAGVRT